MESLSVDVGSGVTKWRRGEQCGWMVSAVGPYNPESFELNGVEHELVETGQLAYIVGDSAASGLKPQEKSDTLNDTWALSPGWQALFYAAIARAYPEGYEGRLAVCTGLPLAYYSRDKAKLMGRLKGEHNFRLGGKRYRVLIEDEDIQLIPQAMGVYFAAAAQDESLLDDLVGVLDIGTYTTGFSLVENNTYRSHNAGGLALGLSDLADALGRYLERRHHFRPARHRLMTAIAKEKIRWEGKNIPLSKELPALAEPLCDPLFKKLEEFWRDEAPEARILLAGGGAPYFLKTIKHRYPHAKLVGNNQTTWRAIVDGYHLFLTDLQEARA